MLNGAPELGNCSVFGRCLLTDCLQPQMKTYRCPWCVSRTNHNILYFVHISRTSSLNTAICLWKLRISLVWRGFQPSNLHRIRGNPGALARRQTHLSTLAPRALRHKAQGWCSFTAILFKLWRLGGNSALSLQPLSQLPGSRASPREAHCQTFLGALGRIVSLSGTNVNPFTR